MDAGASPPRAGRTTLVTAIRDHVLPAVGAIGLVLYGLLRVAYVFFYLQLRTTPEEVGYGYSRVLSESIAGALELSAILGAALLVLAMAYYTGRALPRLIRPNPAGSRWQALRSIHAPLRWRVVVRSLLGGIAIVLLSLPALAWWQGGLAKNGQTVRNVYFVGVPYLPVLAVQAVPAEVTWLDGDEGKPFPLAHRECLMYLGKSDGTSVFYDVRSKESVRLPSGNIAVSLRYTFFTPDACRSGG
jgi:hypothetical protein